MNLADLLAAVPHERLLLWCYDQAKAVHDRLTARTTQAELIAMLLELAGREPRVQQKLDQFVGRTLPMDKLRGIPARTNVHFTGRETELNLLQQYLRPRSGKYNAVAIIGLGGMGKTALAREVAVACAAEFDLLVWTSAKSEIFVSADNIITDRPTTQVDNLGQVWQAVARQAERDDLMRQPLSRELMRAFFQGCRCLIVLDNMESLLDNQTQQLLYELGEVLGTGRVLVTSRHIVKYENCQMHDLGQLPLAAGVEFLQAEATARQVAGLLEAEMADLEAIYQACGGQPLAMRLVVGQLVRGDLDQVLANLAQPRSGNDSYEMYRFIYRFSWQKLSLEAKKLLVSLTVLEPPKSMPLPLLREMMKSKLRAEQFDKGMAELIAMSLVETKPIGLRKQYALHPLTYNFIRSEITKDLG